MFYDQLHMFVHFIGRTDEPWPCINDAAFKEMIAALASLEELLVREKEILFADVNLKLRSEIPTPRALEDLRALSKEPEKA